MNRSTRAPLATLPLILLLAACSGASAPLPAASSGAEASAPTASAPTPVTSADEAAAAVIAADPRFAGLRPLDPNLIGQCCFYQVQATETGYAVTIEVGWGDCPSACINRHRWAFAVTPAGEVTLMGEAGPPVPAGVPGAGSGGAGASAGAGGGGGGVTIHIGIEGIALGGPVCPVVKPNDPACADRPVTGAAIHVIAADGVEVATLETDAEGRFAVELDPGRYRVVADPVQGYMHGPAPVDVTVSTSAAQISLTYDTGIR
jgi:prealbumin domain-containing protein